MRMSSRQQQSSIRISFDGLDAFSQLWGELVDRTDVDEIVLHVVGNYQFSKLASNAANSQRLALSKLIRSFHFIWQIQLLHLFSSPRSRPERHRLRLLSPRAATTSIQFLIQAVTDIFGKCGDQFAVEIGYSIMTGVYDALFCALKGMLLSPFDPDRTEVELLDTELCSGELSGIYNQVLPAQREGGQGANEDNVLTYLRNACQVILYHLQDRNNEESKSVIQFTRDLNVGHFADSNNPHENSQISTHLSSLEGTQSLEQEGSTPPNFRRYCQMYDIYMAIIGICGHHKARCEGSGVLIGPSMLEFAKTAVNKFHAITSKVPPNIQKPVFRLATSLGRFFSPASSSNSLDYFTSSKFFEGFRADLQRRSSMLTLSDPCYTRFRREIGNVFQNMSRVDGAPEQLTAVVDDTVPFAVSNCKHAHIHSQGSRRHIDTTSPPNRRRCHICAYTSDDATITGWREVKELSNIHYALARLRGNLQGITEERLGELPASRVSMLEPFPRISPPVSPPQASGFPQTSGISQAFGSRNQETQEQNQFQGPPSLNGDSLRELPSPTQRGQLSPRWQHYSSGSGGVYGNLPLTPPRSDGPSPVPSPVLNQANNFEHPAEQFRPTAADQVSGITKISSGLVKFARRRLIGSGTPSIFIELFTKEHNFLNTTCAFSRDGQKALFWSKSFLGAFSAQLQQTQAATDAPALRFMHKYAAINMNWDRPVIAVSKDAFAVASQSDSTPSKISIYQLSSVNLRKEIPINDFVSCLAISPDDTLVAAGTKGRNIQIFYTGNSQETRSISLPPLSKRLYTYDNSVPIIQKLSFCHAGQNLVVTTCETVRSKTSGSRTPQSESKVHIWVVSLQSSQKPELWKHFDAPHAYDPGNQGITSVLYNPTRELACVTFWCTSENGGPCIINKSWDKPRRISHHYLQPKIQAAAFSPSGLLLVLVSADGYVFKVNLPNNYHVTRLEGKVQMADKPGESVQLRITEDSRTALVLQHDGKTKAEVKSFSLVS